MHEAMWTCSTAARMVFRNQRAAWLSQILAPIGLFTIVDTQGRFSHRIGFIELLSAPICMEEA